MITTVSAKTSTTTTYSLFIYPIAVLSLQVPTATVSEAAGRSAQETTAASVMQESVVVAAHHPTRWKVSSVSTVIMTTTMVEHHWVYRRRFGRLLLFQWHQRYPKQRLGFVLGGLLLLVTVTLLFQFVPVGLFHILILAGRRGGG